MSEKSEIEQGAILLLPEPKGELVVAGNTGGQEVAMVYHAVDAATGEALQRLLVDIARGGEVVKVNADILLIARGGRQTPIQDSAAPLRDVGGHTIGVIVSFPGRYRHKERAAGSGSHQCAAAGKPD